MAYPNLDDSVPLGQGFVQKLAVAMSSVNARWYSRRLFKQMERPGTTLDSSKCADLIIDDPSIPALVIECSYGGDRDRDADDKLGRGAFQTAIPLSIPESFKRMTEHEVLDALINGETFEYAVKQPGFRFPTNGYIQGNIKDLSSMIRAVSVAKDQVESVSRDVADKVNEAANTMKQGLSDIDCNEIAKLVNQRSDLSGLRTVMILWLDALLVQRRLHKQGDDIDVLSISEIDLDVLLDSWNSILESNWSSVYAPALELLRRSAERAYSETKRAVDLLVKAVNAIENARLGVQINVGAELFPKVSEDQKTASAFYTAPSTAEFLAHLTIRERDQHDWSDPEIFGDRLRIVDLACGTGTLVRAAFNRVRALHDAFNASMESHKQLHKLAMERGIIACDVSPIAAHLTNSSMTVLGSGQPYSNTNIGWVSVGRPVLHASVANANSSVAPSTTGSLEFLKRNALDDLFDSISESATGAPVDENHNGSVSGVQISDATADYVIMNPPYIRTRGGQSAFDIAGLSEAQRKGCQLQWERLIRNEQCVKTAGLAASFVCLGAKKVKPGGRIGFVLPNSAAFAPAWGKTREMLLNEFQNIIAISKAGKSEGKDALSADTHLGEMLLVAERKFQRNPRCAPFIYCVSLNRVPTRQGIAGEFAKSILNEIHDMRSSFSYVRIGDEAIATIEKFEARGKNPWSPLGVLNPELSAAAHGICDGFLMDFASHGPAMKFPVPMTSMNELFDVGPTHHLIGHIQGNEPIGAFTFTEINRKSDTKGGLRALWKADSKSQQSLLTSPTHKGAIFNAQAAARLSERRGTLHYQRGIQWTSQRILVASTEFPVYGGSAWTTLHHKDRRVENAFALWANSTFGFLLHWTRGQRQQRGRARTQVGAINSMPVPNLSQLSEAALDATTNQFNKLAESTLRPACNGNEDAVRHAIDSAVMAMLDMPKDRALHAIDILRGWWCNEPTVTGSNEQ